MRASFLACLVLLFAASVRAADTPDQAAIRAARLAQNAAIVAHDLDRIAFFWTDDVIIQRGFGLQVSGKAGYLQLFRDDGPGSIYVYQRIPEIIDVSPDWPLAFESGYWERRAKDRVIVRGKYSAQWVKRSGQWFIRGEVYVALAGFAEGKQEKVTP